MTKESTIHGNSIHDLTKTYILIICCVMDAFANVTESWTFYKNMYMIYTYVYA